MMQSFDIWVGHVAGIRETIRTRPYKLATVEAASFEMACYRYDLETRLSHLFAGMVDGHADPVAQEKALRETDSPALLAWPNRYYPSLKEALDSYQ